MSGITGINFTENCTAKSFVSSFVEKVLSLLLIGIITFHSFGVARVPDEPIIPTIVHTTTTIAAITTSNLETQPPNTCFYADSSICLLPRENESCKECIPHPTIANSLVCCNVTDIEKSISCVPNPSLTDNSSYWVNLHIYNATLDELDISHKFWKRLDSLVVTDGHIERITKEFTKFSSPHCINVSNNNLYFIHQRAFKELTHLQMLDISHNNLSTMPNLNSISPNLTLDIKGNTGMLCSPVSESMEKGGVHFLNLDSTFCLTNLTFNWFNSTDSISLKQLEHMNKLQSECPKISGFGNCICSSEPMHIRVENGTFLEFTAKVDCSHLNLIELPDRLPTNTIELNVSNNKITSLLPLNENPTYKKLVKFYADDNQISSILDLEGSTFLDVFFAFHLRRNKLKSIPMYMLSNTLDKSPPDAKVLFLEGNQLHCDCNSAKVLKLWLLARQSHINDVDKILCENIKQKVVDLSEIKLCQSHHDWTDYIYLLITAEIILLLALIMKVSYDYWVFKTAGYLPWPANKMPKLPCDWLCES